MSALDIVTESLGIAALDVKELGGYVIGIYASLVFFILVRSFFERKARKEKEELEERKEELKLQLLEMKARLEEIRLIKAEAELKMYELRQSIDESLEEVDVIATNEAFEVYTEWQQYEAEQEMMIDSTEAEIEEIESITNGVD